MQGDHMAKTGLGGHWLQEGYKLEKSISNLTYPVTIEFTPEGEMYLAESGFSYDHNVTTPAISHIDKKGNKKVISTAFQRPLIGLKWYKGAFLVTHRGTLSRVTLDGKREDLITDIPAIGDHHTNHIAINDDKVYFGQGSDTNAGVVGVDNIIPFGWVNDTPNGHDIPPYDIKLTGLNFKSKNPYDVNNPENIVETGAFMPFGKKCVPGQIVKGQLKCNSVVYRCNPDGSGLEVFAWGLRNPFWLSFSPDGRLLCLDQGSDPRGSRPLPCSDSLYEIKQGAWYGFPDFLSGIPSTEIADGVKMDNPHGFVMAEHPKLTKPLYRFPVHSVEVSMDFSSSDEFGYKGEAFIAEYGAIPASAGGQNIYTGHKVLRFDMNRLEGADFYKAERPGAMGTGPERPVFVKFSPDGRTLYTIDFGIIGRPGTGAIWSITRE